MDERNDIDQETAISSSKKIWARAWVKWGIIGCSSIGILICLVIALTARVQLNSVSGPISVTDVRVTSGFDEQGKPLPSDNRFSTQQARIYCYIAVSAPKAVSIGVRWYRENELIFESREMVNQWRAFYIQPLPGERFDEGNYRVEVLLINDPVITIPFSVED